MMNTNGMFMRIDYDPDVVDHIPEPQYWAFPDEWFYPGVDFINELPELVIIKENLEECLPLRVFYGIETESEDDSISEEVILCAFSTEEDDTFAPDLELIRCYILKKIVRGNFTR